MQHAQTAIRSFVSKPISFTQGKVALALLLLTPLAPVQAQPEEEHHSEATLIAENTSIAPGQPFTVALRIRIDPEWHIYWSNPGDTGLATRLTWSLPPGFKSSGLRYAYPKKFGTPPLIGYGYENEVWLLSEITPPSNLTVGKQIGLNATAQWLACSEACIPATAEVFLSLPVAAQPAIDAKLRTAFAEARKQLPVPAHYAGYKVQAKRDSVQNKSKIAVQLAPTDNAIFSDEELKQLYFFATDASTIAAAKPQPVIRSGKSFQITLTPSEFSTSPIKRLRGVVVAPNGKTWGSNAGAKALWIDTPVVSTPIKTATLPSSNKPGR